MKVDTSRIPKYKNKEELTHSNGNTEDIIKVVLEVDSEQKKEMFEFSKQFADGKEGLERLFKFVRDKIKYKVDAAGRQDIKTPAALWAIGEGDCKSKTIFVNSVLYCLNIPYIIRFTRYDNNGTDMKHVYSIAYLNGQAIPMDTVYKKFGKEKPYTFKKDFNMTKISKISGCETTPQIINSKTRRANKIQDLVYTSEDKAGKRLEEIQQKKKYIKQAENIPFNKDSEGVAALKIAKRELEILSVMKPQLKTVCEKGLNLINKAIKGDYSLTGDIPKQLNNLCHKIQMAKQLVMPANSHGILSKRINKLQTERMEDGGCKIGAFPERLCLNGLWFYDTNLNYGYATPEDMARNYGFCGYNNNDMSFAMNSQAPPTTTTAPTNAKLGDYYFLYYGRNSKYRENFFAGWNSFKQTIIDAASQSNPPIKGLQAGTNSGWFDRQMDYDLVLNMISQNSTVLSNYINDIYGTSSQGSVGSGLFYTFTGGVLENGVPVSPNLFPATVIAKGLQQGSFIDGCQAFTGVSRSNLQSMSRNGILMDNGGEQPEATLSTLVRLHQSGTDSIGDFGISAAIIAAIAAAVVGIIAAIADAVAKTKAAETEARTIDNSQADTSRLSSLGQSVMPNENDWAPLQRRGSSGLTGGSNSLLIGGAVALGVGALLMGKDKDKKKRK